MNGRAHWKISALSCAIVSIVPMVNSLAIFNNKFISIPKGISLVGLGVAAIAGLAVDADSQHSKISHMNPVTGAANGIIGMVENIIKIVIRLLLGVGVGLVILKYSKVLIGQIEGIKALKEYAALITYSIAAVFIFAGIASERTLRRMPVVGLVYRDISALINAGANVIKRIAMFLIYAGSGALIIIYNMHNTNDINLYSIAGLLIAIAIFPHRTFLHSIEGTIVFSISMAYLFNKIGYRELTGYFVIGYIAHIYWADIFTKEGVPLFSTPIIIKKILEKFGVKNEILDMLAKFKLKLPPFISTGSLSGNLFENVYILALVLIIIMSYRVYGPAFRIY